MTTLISSASSLHNSSRHFLLLILPAACLALLVIINLQSDSGSSLSQVIIKSDPEIEHLTTTVEKQQKSLDRVQKAQENLNKMFEKKMNHIDNEIQYLVMQRKKHNKGLKGRKHENNKAGSTAATKSLVVVPKEEPWEKDEQTFREKMMLKIDHLLGKAPTTLDLEGYDQQGNFVVHNVMDQEYYYLQIVGLPNHKISAKIESSDGFSKKLRGYAEMFSGPIHQGTKGTKVYIECRDHVTGEVQWFRFSFK